MEKINLICLPFAGGSRYSYRPYEERMPSFLKFLPLDYPGRGSRIREPFAEDMDLLIDQLYREVKHIFLTSEYALYGHSMGALVACLLARRISKDGNPLPAHIFITGAAGPSARNKSHRNRHVLNKPDFIEELRQLKGCPEEILNDPQLLDHFEPIIRADFKISETYQYSGPAQVEVPYTVITGSQEDMEPEDVKCWQQESPYKVDFKTMPGNHFFIFDYPSTIMEIISRKLTKHVKLKYYDRQ
ncbi:MAG TPA: alpha/beta fold hydrolase [Puia sp.]|nr:alpha/beta fold hydrolase [Puia sp.]